MNVGQLNMCCSRCLFIEYFQDCFSCFVCFIQDCFSCFVCFMDFDLTQINSLLFLFLHGRVQLVMEIILAITAFVVFDCETFLLIGKSLQLLFLIDFIMKHFF